MLPSTLLLPSHLRIHKTNIGHKDKARGLGLVEDDTEEFVCECRAELSTKANLKAHRRTNKHKRNMAEKGLVEEDEEAKPKGHPCPVCKTWFPTPSTLRDHRRTAKRKAQVAKMGLEEEVRIDITDSPCDICGISFPNINNLRRHKKETDSDVQGSGYQDRIGEGGGYDGFPLRHLWDIFPQYQQSKTAQGVGKAQGEGGISATAFVGG